MLRLYINRLGEHSETDRDLSTQVRLKVPDVDVRTLLKCFFLNSGLENLNSIKLAWDRIQWRALMNGSSSIKGVEI
jgi:hypothetical protein